MAQTSGAISHFPSQAVSDSEKQTYEYGKQVAAAIEAEWFTKDSGVGRYFQTREEYHRLRLYARGEQSTTKYKDELSVNGDLSYLNLDWEPVPIIPKFVDIVVNGMQDRLFTIKAFAQDPIATAKRTKFVEEIEEDMQTKQLIQEVGANMGVDVANTNPGQLPDTTEELELYMQLEYKQGIEIAIEQAVENVLKRNRFHEVKKQMDYDQTILGISCIKHGFNNTDGITIRYVDPADLVFSYTEQEDFRDCYYFGEVKRLRMNEVKKMFPHLSNSELEDISKKGSQWTDYNSFRYEQSEDYDSNTVNIIFFEWKTWESDVHKVKQTASGGLKALKKNDQFNPPQDLRAKFEKVEQARECIYEGAMVLGTEILLKWEKMKNMVRPDSNANQVRHSYIVNVPRLYKGRIESLVRRMIKYADLIQLTHLKLQQTIQRMTPSGVYLDADGLAEIDLGNGTAYNPQEALNMYFQTGSVIGRSMTVDGDPNGGKIPIQELPGGGGGQLEILVGAYNHYLNMIRDVTGLNEARDGTDPDPYALVGVQKLAAANSNTATRHILMAGMAQIELLADGIVTRVKDVIEYHPQAEAWMQSLGRFSVGSLKEMMSLHHHDFGIFLELSPDEEQKQMVEANIQQALSRDQIYLEDAIDVREIKNIKLANQLLKFRRKKKIMLDQQINERNIQVQADANAKAAKEAEMAKAQAEQIKTQSKGQLSQIENELAIKKMEIEAMTKKELMRYEFELNKKLKMMELEAQKELMGIQTKNQEDIAEKNNQSAEKRERMKASAKPATGGKSTSGPPSSGKPSKSFESKGNDVLGSIDLSRFEPK